MTAAAHSPPSPRPHSTARLPHPMVSNSLTDRMVAFSESRCAADSPMLIICPSCATSYDVDLANLSPNGRQVRCARCRTIWHAEPSHADKLLLAAAALAPGAGADDQPEAAEPEDRFADEPRQVPIRVLPVQCRCSARPPRRRRRLPNTALGWNWPSQTAVPVRWRRRRLSRLISTRAGRVANTTALPRPHATPIPRPPKISKASRRGALEPSAHHCAGRCRACRPRSWRSRSSIPFSSVGGATWCVRCRRRHPSIRCSGCP